MRLMLSMAVAAVALTGLAACGQSEEAYRANLRTQGIANCQRGSNPAVASQLQQMGLTVEQLCTCAIDRYMRGASYEQLKADQNNPSPPALEAATAQCVAERVGQTPAGAAPASNQPLPSPEAPAAPAEPAPAEENAAE